MEYYLIFDLKRKFFDEKVIEFEFENLYYCSYLNLNLYLCYLMVFVDEIILMVNYELLYHNLNKKIEKVNMIDIVKVLVKIYIVHIIYNFLYLDLCCYFEFQMSYFIY